MYSLVSKGCAIDSRCGQQHNCSLGRFIIYLGFDVGEWVGTCVGKKVGAAVGLSAGDIVGSCVRKMSNRSSVEGIRLHNRQPNWIRIGHFTLQRLSWIRTLTLDTTRAGSGEALRGESFAKSRSRIVRRAPSVVRQ